LKNVSKIPGVNAMSYKMPRSDGDQSQGCSTRLVVIIGLITSLSVGFLDTAIDILNQPASLSSFSFALAPAAVTTVVFFLCYVLIWFSIAAHLARFLKAAAVPVAISLALFMGTLFTLDEMIEISFTPNDIMKFLVLVLISLVIAAGSYFSSITISSMPRVKLVFASIAYTLPFILVETMIFVWFHIYKISAFRSIESVLLNIAFISIICATFGLVFRMAKKHSPLPVLTVFTMLVFLSPLVLLNIPRSVRHPASTFTGSKHSIKHVILLTIDTLRRDALSCYGSKTTTTKSIDQLALDGVLFSEAISPAPWTLPAIASIMTGLSPSVHKALRAESMLADALPTLAEYMRDAGYYTSAIGDNLYLVPIHNISQGFLEYNFFPKPSLGTSFGERLLHRIFPRDFQIEVSTTDITQLTAEWLESHHDKDFFLWVHYFDPHGPYSPPAKFLPKTKPPRDMGPISDFMKISTDYELASDQMHWLKDLYDGEVRYVDENIGRLLHIMKQLDLYDESLIILTSDHGEEFWEHDGHGHGNSLHNEVLRVPLIIKLPRSSAKGTVTAPVSTESLMPTILDVCGIECKKEYLAVGSLSALWSPHPSTYEELPIFSTGVRITFRGEQECILFRGLKYIRSPLMKHGALYNLDSDPDERTSIALTHPDLVQEAKNILLMHHRMSEKQRETFGLSIERTELNKETIERLKALGYL
jgi:arylsulfatase A-like enzyme